MVALSSRQILFAVQSEQIEGVVERFSEAIEAGRIGLELTEAIGASERNGSHKIEALLRDGDETGAAIARIGPDDAEIEPAQFVDRLAQRRCMHIEPFSQRGEGHMGALGERVKHGQLQASDAVALFQFEMKGGDGGIEPHPGDESGKSLLLHSL